MEGPFPFGLPAESCSFLSILSFLAAAGPFPSSLLENGKNAELVLETEEKERVGVGAGRAEMRRLVRSKIDGFPRVAGALRIAHEKVVGWTGESGENFIGSVVS